MVKVPYSYGPLVTVVIITIIVTAMVTSLVYIRFPLVP